MKILLLSLLTCPALTCATKAAPVIGTFDTSRGGDYSPGFGAGTSIWRAHLATTFPGVTFAATTTLTGAFLSTVNILMIDAVFGGSTPITPLSPAEQTALVNFVMAGGSALLFADNDIQFEAAGDSIVSPFGFDSTGTVAGSTGATVFNLSHPVANGPFGTVTNYDQWYPGWFPTIGPGAAGIATLDTNGRSTLAAIAPGVLSPTSGGVVFFSDISALDNGTYSPSKFTLVDNAIAFVPEPSAALLLIGSVSALLSFRRKRSQH